MVPIECRVAGSFFTHMSVIGRLQEKGEVPIHFDEKDTITALVHLGSTSKGGSTLYYNGNTVKDHGKIVHKVPFLHGQIQIGNFNDTLHSAEKWTGNRGCINFNLKMDVVNHFQTYGMRYFQHYRRNKYPKGVFFAT